jgi:UDP-N-acetylglucosamine--N-acetylmuramyl-(pentapeptide) pyrophosphoryl-undecaprenol N-acetylglucosamine transferase
MVTGTPVRPQFQPLDAAACRLALGLAPEGRVVLVMGGSQGAAGINELVARALPGLASRVPQWQWIHLAGAGDAAELSKTYSRLGFKALVVPFLDRMELAMGAADAAVSRAGASSLAELAAMRLPAVLIPYPSATDNHQFHNARAFEQSGAARLLDQSQATPEALIGLLDQLMVLMDQSDTSVSLRAALGAWHAPQAAERVTEMILDEIAAATALSASPTALVPRRCL